MNLSPALKKRYTQEQMSALEAQRFAEFIAWGPIIFQASRLMIKFGILDLIRDSQEGMTRQELTEKTHLSDYAVKLDGLIMKFRLKRESLIDELHEISSAIEAVEDPRCNILLRYRYIQLKKWEDIATYMNYHVDYVKRELHGYALSQFKLPTKSLTDV